LRTGSSWKERRRRRSNSPCRSGRALPRYLLSFSGLYFFSNDDLRPFREIFRRDHGSIDASSNTSNVTFSGLYPLFLSTGSNLFRGSGTLSPKAFPVFETSDVLFNGRSPNPNSQMNAPDLPRYLFLGSFPGEHHHNKVKYEPRNPQNLSAQGGIPMNCTVSGTPEPFVPDFDRPGSFHRIFEQPGGSLRRTITITGSTCRSGDAV
jgi:hypothetical protein